MAQNKDEVKAQFFDVQDLLLIFLACLLFLQLFPFVFLVMLSVQARLV